MFMCAFILGLLVKTNKQVSSERWQPCQKWQVDDLKGGKEGQPDLSDFFAFAEENCADQGVRGTGRCEKIPMASRYQLLHVEWCN